MALLKPVTWDLVVSERIFAALSTHGTGTGIPLAATMSVPTWVVVDAGAAMPAEHALILLRVRRHHNLVPEVAAIAHGVDQVLVPHTIRRVRGQSLQTHARVQDPDDSTLLA